MTITYKRLIIFLEKRDKMEQSTLSVRGDSNDKKCFELFEIYTKLLEAEQEMDVSSKRYTSEEVLENMKNSIR